MVPLRGVAGVVAVSCWVVFLIVDAAEVLLVFCGGGGYALRVFFCTAGASGEVRAVEDADMLVGKGTGDGARRRGGVWGRDRMVEDDDGYGRGELRRLTPFTLDDRCMGDCCRTLFARSYILTLISRAEAVEEGLREYWSPRASSRLFDRGIGNRPPRAIPLLSCCCCSSAIIMCRGSA